MNFIDILIIAVVIVSGVLGLYWGIIRQILSLVGLIAGIVLAGRYGPNVAEWLSSCVPDTRAVDIIAFALVVIAVSSAASLLASLLHRFVGLLFLGWADHLLGGVLGLLQGALTATVLIAVIAANPTGQISAALRDSQFAAPVLQSFDVVLALMPEAVRQSAEIFLGGL
ncbi:MAG: CvpA family protein [Roseiflexaceae bacterium]|nr:CvpA family protein [Roseiflexaceae bacterium]